MPFLNLRVCSETWARSICCTYCNVVYCLSLVTLDASMKSVAVISRF